MRTRSSGQPMRFSFFAASFVVIYAAPALAQRAPDRAVTFGAFGGSTAPVTRGDAPQIYDAGMHAGVLAELRTPLRWLALRADGSYQRLGTGARQLVDGTGQTLGQLFSHASVMTASANVVARAPGLRTLVQPYAVAGVTVFRVQSRVSQSGGPSLGPLGAGQVVHSHSANVGLGLEAPLGRTQLFVEARYARMGPATGLLPLSLGVKFR